MEVRAGRPDWRFDDPHAVADEHIVEDAGRTRYVSSVIIPNFTMVTLHQFTYRGTGKNDSENLLPHWGWMSCMGSAFVRSLGYRTGQRVRLVGGSKL